MLAIPVYLQLRFLSSCDSNPYGVLPIKKESYPSDLEKKNIRDSFCLAQTTSCTILVTRET